MIPLVLRCFFMYCYIFTSKVYISPMQYTGSFILFPPCKHIISVCFHFLHQWYTCQKMFSVSLSFFGFYLGNFRELLTVLCLSKIFRPFVDQALYFLQPEFPNAWVILRVAIEMKTVTSWTAVKGAVPWKDLFLICMIKVKCLSVNI